MSPAKPALLRIQKARAGAIAYVWAVSKSQAQLTFG